METSAEACLGVDNHCLMHVCCAGQRVSMIDLTPRLTDMDLAICCMKTINLAPTV